MGIVMAAPQRAFDLTQAHKDVKGHTWSQTGSKYLSFALPRLQMNAYTALLKVTTPIYDLDKCELLVQSEYD